MASETPVQSLDELRPGQLYRIDGGNGRQHYFTVRKFFWNDADDNILGIAESPDPTDAGADPDAVDDANSFVGLNYFDGYCSDPPVENIKRDIREGKYLHIGDLDANRHRIPESN